MKKKDWSEEAAIKLVFKVIKMQMIQGREIHKKIGKYKQALAT